MGHLWQLNDFKDHTFMRELSVILFRPYRLRGVKELEEKDAE
jgi:hypothetical protein